MPKIPKKEPDIEFNTCSDKILIWIEKITDDNNVEAYYKYDTSNFGKRVAYMALISGIIYYKFNKSESWNTWVIEDNEDNEDDDTVEIKQLLKRYIHELVEKELFDD